MGVTASTTVTAEDQAFFNEQGYWVSPEPLFDDHELARARAAAWAFWDGHRNRLLPDGSAFPPFDGSTGLRKNDYASLVVDDLWALVAKPLLAATAAALGSHAGLRFWHDQLLLKPPQATSGTGAVAVGWHTDRGYWGTCSSAEMLTAWIAIDPVTPDMGPLQVVPGSHHWPDPYDGDFFARDLADQWRAMARGHAEAKAVALPLAAGQVSFHHCRTVHGSGANIGRQARLGLAVHLQPVDNHYRVWLRPDGSQAHHANDSRVRRIDGVPDYADPGWCPRLL